MGSDPDYTLGEEDVIACNALGGDEAVWCGVSEEPGLRWTGAELNAAIAFGIGDSRQDFAP
jgi:hypothetical protein